MRSALFGCPGECIEDQTARHTEKTDEERKVVGFGWVRVARAVKGLNHSSQGRHEDGRSGHAEEIDPGDGRG